MSFTREDYQKTFSFALRMLNIFESRDEQIEREATELMWRVENVIGQQSSFPLWARQAWPNPDPPQALPRKKPRGLRK